MEANFVHFGARGKSFLQQAQGPILYSLQFSFYDVLITALKWIMVYIVCKFTFSIKFTNKTKVNFETPHNLDYA